MRAIGGYFGLELPHFEEYHRDALRLNSGRFCIEYLLRCRKYSKVYVPYFICDTAIQPFDRVGTPYEFYHIDKDYRIIDDIQLADNEALFYVNYWGLHSDYCLQLALKYGKQLILDYTQAFYARPIEGIDTIYSCRKFFGVPDGGYLYTDAVADFEVEQDESYERMDSLVKRIDISPEAGYDDFHKTSNLFYVLPIRRMSRFTQRMMEGIDYASASAKRRANYTVLQNALGGKELEEREVPMIFPYSSLKGPTLRKQLIEKKVFVAKYWPNVDVYAGENALETWMSNHVLPLPIDQRNEKEDIDRIVDIINAMR